MSYSSLESARNEKISICADAAHDSADIDASHTRILWVSQFWIFKSSAEGDLATTSKHVAIVTPLSVRSMLWRGRHRTVVASEILTELSFRLRLQAHRTFVLCADTSWGYFVSRTVAYPRFCPSTSQAGSPWKAEEENQPQ